MPFATEQKRRYARRRRGALPLNNLGVACLIIGRMARIEVNLLTDGGNNAVIHMPGRKFPGVLVQGDALNALAQRVTLALAGCLGEEAHDAIAGVAADLHAMLTRYEQAVQAEGLRLPGRG